MGRPPTYDRNAVIEVFCQQVSTGTPMIEVCRQPGMPDLSTVWDWQQKDPVIDRKVIRAREAHYDAIAARVRKTARGFGVELGGDSTGDVKRDRLIVDTDLKLLAKWDPKRYGEGFQLRHADADGNKIEASPRFAEALALLRMGGPPAPINVTPKRVVQDDISDLL